LVESLVLGARGTFRGKQFIVGPIQFIVGKRRFKIRINRNITKSGHELLSLLACKLNPHGIYLAGFVKPMFQIPSVLTKKAEPVSGSAF
jgi:hypothetical protein